MRRILAIDGGGIRGLVPAAFLAVLEEQLPEPVVDYFDLVVGTSTGGIIALGLGAGMPASAIRDFYLAHGEGIFSGSRVPRWLRHMAIGKYSASGLQSALNDALGTTRLGDSKTRLVVPSVNLETGAVHIYKTSHHPRLERDYKELMVDVALATAAAPTYLPTYRSSGGIPLVDGGLFANNPIGLAVVEAIGVLDWPRHDLRVLSLGCGTEPLAIDLARRRNMGRLYWAPKVVGVFLAAQASSSYGTAQLLAGHENVIRIDPTLPAGRFGLDVTSEMPSLRGIGESEARTALPTLRPVFFTEKAVPFTPEHT
jgi:patatin-like phospholipase/acyl hydrolase